MHCFLLHLKPNPSIENIQKIDMLLASNNMHRICMTAPAI